MKQKQISESANVAKIVSKDSVKLGNKLQNQRVSDELDLKLESLKKLSDEKKILSLTSELYWVSLKLDVQDIMNSFDSENIKKYISKNIQSN